ncbi:SDR family NAD(P)-dependent oxidoreductase [Peribacillus simplex]|uniref:SDR family NAD(P)-dependent oxidoreductase n=1 Tax=Peribacillus simplex TaxID=1478 RepID=UPI003672B220
MMNKRIAFITGAGSGIGREIAKKLASRNFNILVADINHKNAEETVSLIGNSGFEARAVHCECNEIRKCKKSR